MSATAPHASPLPPDAPATTLDASCLAEDVPPATLAEARALTEALAQLLSRERTAAAGFLLALADFDRRRGWERLGHASLFAFLTRDLGLSKGGAFFRLTAARLLRRYPEILEPLRDGRLCVTAVVELARVLTPENRGDVIPRFFGCSSREAREVAAALAPREAPPVRTVITTVMAQPPLSITRPGEAQVPAAAPIPATVQSTEPLQAAHGKGPIGDPAPRLVLASPRAEVEPLTADLRRLHLTVSRGFLEKVAAARDGLSHARPGATTEQVLEAALDLLLERQARRKALVKRPRHPASGAADTPAMVPTDDPPSTPSPAAAPDPTAAPDQTTVRSPNPRHIPAHVEREVRRRDQGRCQYPIDGGGTCGSTWQLQLDHLVPVALGGEGTVANLRCTCGFPEVSPRIGTEGGGRSIG